MPLSSPQSDPSPQKEQDVYFQCERCGSSLVVDRAAAGLTLTCQRCGEPTTVPIAADRTPAPELPPEDAREKRAELQRRLQENQSQRTEVNGYVNQLNIQLHRWQLRLQTLNERHAELTTVLGRFDPKAGKAGQ